MARILLVEDDESLRVLFALRLGRSGYHVTTADNGREALDLIAREPFDLVLLDIMMPGMDGLETLRILRRTHSPTDLPVIMCTALDRDEDVANALGLGANDYVTKPQDFSVVLARVNTQLTIGRLHRELRERHDRIERELEVVANVQRSLLPKRLPDIETLKLASHYATSRYAGGDYYDIIELPEGQWGFFVADVSGHGTPSAVLMAMACAYLHAYPGPAVRPDRVIDHLNRHVSCFADGMGEGMFVTALYAVYDSIGRTLRLSRAGHMPPLLHRSGHGSAVELHGPPVPPLGVVAYDGVPCTKYDLAPGDRVLFYTDGVTERNGPGGTMYGIDRLGRQLVRAAATDPQQTIDAIVRDIDTFAAGRPDDDQALLLGVVR